MRIVSAAPAITEIITGLGLGGRIIASDKYSAALEGVPQDIPAIDFFYPDLEALIGLEPDIIISSEVNNFGAADSPFKPLGDMGVILIQIPTALSIADIYGDIRRIAGALGVPGQGETLAALMQAEVEALAGKSREAAQRPRVYFEAASHPSPVSLGSGVYLNEMIQMAGGKNIFAGERGWFSPAAEAVIAADPELIFVLSDSRDKSPADFAKRPGFEGIRAVKDGKIYPLDTDSASRPSPHITKALAQMARALHPEIYGP